MTAACRPAGDDAPPRPAPSPSHPKATRFISLWSAPLLDRPAVVAGLVIAIVGLCLLRAYSGLSGIQVYSHDAFGTLDGAWRVLQGQKPHADFYTPLGPLIYLATAFGLLLSRGGAEGFGYSQAFCGCLLGFWAYRLSRRRLGHLPTILMCLTVVLLSIDPSSVGEPPPSTSCMFYNRYGYALVAMLLVESVAPCDPATRRRELWGGFSTGVILALLLFLKISYFVGGIALAAALIPCRKQVKDRWAGAGCGFLAVFLIFWTYLDFNLVPMWNDLRMVSGAKSARMTWFIVDNLYMSVAFYLAFIFTAAGFLSSAGARPAARAVRIAGVAVCLAGLFLLSTNFQFYGLPLGAVMAILVLKQIGARPVTGKSNTLKHAALLAVGSLLVAWSLSYEAMGLGFAASQKREWQETPHASFNAGNAGKAGNAGNASPLAGFRTFEKSYVELVNDGLSLVNQYRRPGDTVMSLDFSNPFSYALGMRPAPGGATTLHYRGNFNEAHHPAPERLFGQASLVMVPVVPSDQGLLFSIPRIYGPYLAAHFHPIGESPGWRLYRHNQEPVAGHAL